jgi:hypothetical protein
MEFKPFPKISRWNREVIVTEKIDGTNASIYIDPDGEFLTGSRNRWITPDNDNYGFSKWAYENKEELLKLGPGHHFGEWWGQGIQRNYGLKEKRFSLFNVCRWGDNVLPYCFQPVPILFRKTAEYLDIPGIMAQLKETGSKAAPGFMKPEGIIIYFVQNGAIFKKTFDKDAEGKGQ